MKMIKVAKEKARRILQRSRLLPATLRTAHYHLSLGPVAPRRRETIYIDPRKIRGHMWPELSAYINKQSGFFFGAVVAGDWDQQIEYKNFVERGDVYESCRLHWIDGKNWEDVPLFKKHINRITSGEMSDGCRSVGELRSRYEKLDRIYYDICRQGGMSRRYNDLVRISIARDGSLVWGPDGRHRICMAILAGLKRMPVRVGFVHPYALDYFRQLRRIVYSKKGSGDLR